MKREACSLGTMISISTQSPSWRAFRHQQTARPPRHLLSVASPAWQMQYSKHQHVPPEWLGTSVSGTAIPLAIPPRQVETTLNNWFI